MPRLATWPVWKKQQLTLALLLLFTVIARRAGMTLLKQATSSPARRGNLNHLYSVVLSRRSGSDCFVAHLPDVFF